MVYRGRADQLAEQDKKHRIADAEFWGDEGDGEHVEGDQDAGEEEVFGGSYGLGQAGAAEGEPDQRCAENGYEKQDHSGRDRRSQPHTKCSIQGGQDRDAYPGGEHG